MLMFPKPIRRKKSKRETNPLKQQRVYNPEAVEAAKKPFSELTGLPTFGAAPHHLIPVGSGGPDHAYNLIQLTASEHIEAHMGNISNDILFAIVAEREKVTVEYLLSEINRMRGRG